MSLVWSPKCGVLYCLICVLVLDWHKYLYSLVYPLLSAAGSQVAYILP